MDKKSHKGTIFQGIDDYQTIKQIVENKLSRF